MLLTWGFVPSLRGVVGLQPTSNLYRHDLDAGFIVTSMSKHRSITVPRIFRCLLAVTLSVGLVAFGSVAALADFVGPGW
jgi:hypothetical protein